jgi:transposase-like protein
MKRIDWPAVKSAYVNGNETFAQVAVRHNLNANSLRRRAAREHWTTARAARADSLFEKVTERSVIDAAQELASYNAGDLRIAKELRDLVMQRLQNGSNLSPCDIRQLAGAIESVQRVARLSLGASTDNVVKQPPPEPELDLSQLSDEEFSLFTQLCNKATRPKETPQGGPSVN